MRNLLSILIVLHVPGLLSSESYLDYFGPKEFLVELGETAPRSPGTLIELNTPALLGAAIRQHDGDSSGILEISLDEDEATITFKKVTWQVPPRRFTFTRIYQQGLTTKTLAFDVNLDGFSVSTGPSEPAALTVAREDFFIIGGEFGPTIVSIPNAQVLLTGSYRIVGSEEEKSGEFSVQAELGDLILDHLSSERAHLDLADYPERVRLVRGGSPSSEDLAMGYVSLGGSPVNRNTSLSLFSTTIQGIVAEVETRMRLFLPPNITLSPRSSNLYIDSGKFTLRDVHYERVTAGDADPATNTSISPLLVLESGAEVDQLYVRDASEVVINEGSRVGRGYFSAGGNSKIHWKGGVIDVSVWVTENNVFNMYGSSFELMNGPAAGAVYDHSVTFTSEDYDALFDTKNSLPMLLRGRVTFLDGTSQEVMFAAAASAWEGELNLIVPWADWAIDASGWVDTGDFLGWIYPKGDWVWSNSLNKWLYIPADSVRDSGSWIYTPR